MKLVKKIKIHEGKTLKEKVPPGQWGWWAAGKAGLSSGQCDAAVGLLRPKLCKLMTSSSGLLSASQPEELTAISRRACLCKRDFLPAAVTPISGHTLDITNLIDKL